MPESEEGRRPVIIVRRKIVSGGAHHGGAWKVAYADFVTAMMAFFLLMWLLNATTEEQRKGLADYFSPSIPVHRSSGGGDGPFAGNSVFAEEHVSQTGTGATSARAASERQAQGRTGVDIAAPLEAPLESVAATLMARGGESEIADRLLRHVRLRRTDEGLVIEVAALPDAPLFETGTATPTGRMRALMEMIAEVIAIVTNPVAVDAHLETDPISRPNTPGWRLTAERALAARDLLAVSGVSALRFFRVTGEADRAPAYPDPREIRNRRTEIVLLKTKSEEE